jgi:hypothetical protein
VGGIDAYLSTLASIYSVQVRNKSQRLYLAYGNKTGVRRSIWGKLDSQDNREWDQARKKETRSVVCVHTIAKGVVYVWQ